MIGQTKPTPCRPTWATARELATPWAPPIAGPTVFVVPHPDDEILIMGGLLARQLDAGTAVTVVAVGRRAMSAGRRVAGRTMTRRTRGIHRLLRHRLIPPKGLLELSGEHEIVVRMGADHRRALVEDVLFAFVGPRDDAEPERALDKRPAGVVGQELHDSIEQPTR